MARTVADLQVQVGVDGVDGVKRALGSVGDSVDGVAGKFGGAFGQAAGNLISGFVTSAGSSLMGLAGSLIGSNAQLETLSNSFTIAVGDADEASRMFANLQKFAASTPFEFPELIQAATNLEALGIDSEKYLTTLGNVAAGTGKTLDQATQAFMDASVGEFERLKEFGIQTKREGDNVVFSYMENGKMVTKTVDATNQEVIQSTLAGIWNDKYAGAMETQSKSFAGLMSTLRDNINMTMAKIGKPIFEFAKRGLQAMVGFFSIFDAQRKAGLAPFQAAIVALKLSLMKLFGAQYSQAIRKTIDSIASALVTAKNVAGVALGFISNLFGRAFGWIVANGPMVMAALKGIGIALLGIGAAAAVLAIAGGALALLTSPIFLIAAAAAGLGIAWKTNFLGIRDITAKVVAAMGPLWDRLKAALAVIVGWAGKAWQAMRSAFAGIVSAMQPLVPIVGMVMGVLGNLIGYLVDVARGGDVMTSAFSSLPGPIATIFQFIGNSIAIFRDVAVGVFNVISALIHGDFAGAWDALKGMVVNVVEDFVQRFALLGQLFGQVLAGLWAGIQAAWPTISGWLSSMASVIPGYLADALTWLGQAGTDLLTGLYNALVAYWPTVSAWFTALAAEVPGYLSTALTWLTQAGTDLLTGLYNALVSYWPTVSAWFTALAAEIPGYLSTALTWLTQAGTDLLTGLQNAIVAYWPTVSAWFTALAAEVPGYLSTALTWLTQAGTDILTGLYNAIVAYWPTVSAWFTGIASEVPGYLSTALTWLTQAGTDLITGLSNAIVAAWPTVSTWFVNLATEVPGYWLNALTWLTQAGTDLLTGLYDALVAYWPTVSDWFVGLATEIPGYWLNALTWLVQAGTDVLTGLWDGIEEYWPTISDWFVGLATEIPGYWLNALTWLVQAGTDLLTGLWDGISAYWESDLKPWLSSVPSLLLEAVGSLANTLWNEGYNIVWGLAQGIYDNAEEIVGNAIDWAAGLIPGWARKALGIESPSKVMMPIGRYVTEGLAVGIRQGGKDALAAMDDVAGMVSGYQFGSPTIAMAGRGGIAGADGRFMTSTAGGGSTTTSTTTQTFNISLNLADLKELVAAAEFVQALPRERQLVLAGGV